MVARSNRRSFDEGMSTAVKENIRKSIMIFNPEFTDENADKPPEAFLMDQMASRPRAMSHHLQSAKVPSRRWLTTKARFWRAMMGLGMRFYDFAPPKPPKPSFVRRLATDTIPIELFFYLPSNYQQKINDNPNYRFPIVVNFHGGGFCLGHATDDRYWARVILEKTPAIFISVNYRRAPEHPFPQPVDDCVEALLYLQSHAEELHLDPSRVALSGFSAGGNLAFTVPFRLTYQYEKLGSKEHLPLRTTDSAWVPKPDSEPTSPQFSEPPEVVIQADGAAGSPTESPVISRVSTNPQNLSRTTTNQSDRPTQRPGGPTNKFSSNVMLRNATSNSALSHGNLLDVPGPRSKLLRTLTQESIGQRTRNTNDQQPSTLSRVSTGLDGMPPRLRIVSILAWYPLLDWTSSRSQKKRGSRNPKKTLPKLFTDLFDFSYLPAPDVQGHHCSPYASPALAPDHMIRDGLPNRIQMWLCEWDMLLAEGENFSQRLTTLGKDCKSEIIPGVPHGWDKSPNPFRDQRSIDKLYERAAGYLNGVFGEASRKMTVGEGIGLGGMR